MYILFDRNTLEVIATIGAKEDIGAETDIVKEPYELMDLGNKEPLYKFKDGKLTFDGLIVKGE